MSLSQWDSHPDFKTSAALMAPTLPEHYAVLKQYFLETDVILDVGCGDNSFSNYIANTTGVDENTDLTTYDLSSYNTLHFSESIGYISSEILERLISSSNIKKVVIKDFLLDDTPNYIDGIWNYNYPALKHVVLPLLEKYGYIAETKEFITYVERFVELMKKHNIVPQGNFFIKSWIPYETYFLSVIVTATRP